MVCRCSSPDEHASRAVAREAGAHRTAKARLQEERDEARRELAALAPDASRFEVVDVGEVGEHLLLKVRYASCERCAYEGDKVLVYLNTGAADALRWRRIDPHFTDARPETPADAPPPAARFPASPSGWSDAKGYANSKRGG